MLRKELKSGTVFRYLHKEVIYMVVPRHKDCPSKYRYSALGSIENAKNSNREVVILWSPEPIYNEFGEVAP